MKFRGSACQHRLSLVEVEHILGELGLVVVGVGPVNARRTRAGAMAERLGIRPSADEFGRPSVSRPEAERIVRAVGAAKDAVRRAASEQAANAARATPEAKRRTDNAPMVVTGKPVKLPPGVRLTYAGRSMLDVAP